MGSKINLKNYINAFLCHLKKEELETSDAVELGAVEADDVEGSYVAENPYVMAKSGTSGIPEAFISSATGMEFIQHFFLALIELSNAMAPYILFGLIFAGILHEFVPDTLVTKHLGKDNIFSVLKATIFGVPLPVCSCGVIPLATSIKKSGASKGSTLSFLISTPITGVDSILATYGIFGWIFTIYRVVTSMIIAMVAGILTNIFDKEENIVQAAFSPVKVPNSLSPTFSMQKPEESSCCSTASSCCTPEKKHFWFTSAMRYAFHNKAVRFYRIACENACNDGCFISRDI